MTQLLNSFLGDLRDLVFPNNCVICNAYIENPENSICNKCFGKIEPTWLEDWKDELKISTGATASECAKVLKSNGALKVTAVSCCTPLFDY